MIGRDIVKELEGMCKALAVYHAQQGRPSLAQPAEIRILGFKTGNALTTFEIQQ